MTQEDKELLLKDLCARLPYGIKVLCLKDFNHKWYNFERVDIGDNEVYLTTNPYGLYLNRYVGIEAVRPYLFPLSSMTLEQRCKLRNLLPNNCDVSFKNLKITFYDEGNIQLEQLEKVFNFLNLYHFDYRGLIPKGLAIDATRLNIY